MQTSRLNQEHKRIKLAQSGFDFSDENSQTNMPKLSAKNQNQKKVTFKNEFYLFGGRTEDRQVSKLQSCSVKKLFDLPFDFQFGACGTYTDFEESFKKEFSVHIRMCLLIFSCFLFENKKGFYSSLLWEKPMECMSEVMFDRVFSLAQNFQIQWFKVSNCTEFNFPALSIKTCQLQRRPFRRWQLDTSKWQKS